jgi:CRP-like cAMP-binding protein
MADDRNPRLRVLYSGRVSVESAMLQLNQHELLPGTIFGEQVLLHDASQPRTIRCSTACLILTLGRAVFEHRVKRFVPNHLIEDAANKIAFLRQIPITRGWPQAILASFARRAVVQTFARNALVLDQGRENTLFFLVLEGELKVVKDGRKVGRIRRGDIFGEISLLQNSLTHAAVVDTMRAATCVSPSLISWPFSVRIPRSRCKSRRSPRVAWAPRCLRLRENRPERGGAEHAGQDGAEVPFFPEGKDANLWPGKIGS